MIVTAVCAECHLCCVTKWAFILIVAMLSVVATQKDVCFHYFLLISAQNHFRHFWVKGLPDGFPHAARLHEEGGDDDDIPDEAEAVVEEVDENRRSTF